MDLFHNSTGYHSDNPVSIPLVIGGSVVGAIVLFLIILVVVLWRKYTNSKNVIRNLADTELDEFNHGDNKEPMVDGELLCFESSVFNPNEIMMNQSLIIEEQVLARGKFTIVRKGVFQNQPVAVKSCQPNADTGNFKEFLLEVKLMNFIGEHENIVKFYGAVVEKIMEEKCFAVTELSTYGNLNLFLQTHGKYYDGQHVLAAEGTGSIEQGAPRIVLTQRILVSYCRQVANGMEFLSQKKVIHGDLATRNVVVFDNHVVKITEFGISSKICDSTKMAQTPLPWRWMALESLRYLRFSSKSDVWSFGVTVWEIFSLAKVPFAGARWTTDFPDEIERGLRLSKPAHAPENVFSFMRKCWENDADDRPCFSECKIFFTNQSIRLET